MLTLYVRTGCPYCGHVLETGKELGITFNERNVADDGVAEELIERGGRERVPFLIDEDKGVSMYESDAIIEYLHQRFK